MTSAEDPIVFEPAGGELSTAIDKELAKPFFRPRSRDLSRLYDERNATKRLAGTRLVVTLLTIFCAISVGTDAILLPDVLALSVITRLILIPLIAISVIVRSYGSTDVTRFERDTAIAIAIAVLLWCLLLLASGDHHGVVSYLAIAPIFLVVAAIFSNLPFRVAVPCTGAVYAILMGTLAFEARTDLDLFVVNGTLLSWTMILTLFANWRIGSERFSIFLYEIKMGLQQEVIVERNAELLRLSETDALTGVANRRCLDEGLARRWTAWSSHKDPFALLIVDIDFFKRFNDHYGHQAGDACLREVADVLAGVARANGGMVGRFGGEEFVVLSPTGHVAAIGESLRATVADLRMSHMNRPDGLSFITVSVGGAFSGQAACDSAETLFGFADRALYLAKASGRNRVCAGAGLPTTQTKTDQQPPADDPSNPVSVGCSDIAIARHQPVACCA